MNCDVFTYGSLMFPEVWKPLVAEPRASVAATLDGYQREGIRGQSYPGIRAQPGARTAGRLYLDVGPDALARLDAFEGDEYRRETVMVMITTPDGRRIERSAQVYRPVDTRQLDGVGWDADAFGRTTAAGFYRQHASGQPDRV